MQLFATLKPADLVAKATTFKANSRIKRVVFICTPHRGSKMASGAIGELGIKLISLPVDLTTTLKSEIPEETLRKINNGRLPNSVSNLKPNAPYLVVMNKQSIQAPYHSIIGNRGKPGPLADSSDGVVPYWSSHLDGAKSECIVPGPHGSCELPQTIAELDRILRLHIGASGTSKPATTIAHASRCACDWAAPVDAQFSDPDTSDVSAAWSFEMIWRALRAFAWTLAWVIALGC